MANQGEGPPPPGQNIQDLFLSGARRHQLAVTIQLMDGTCVDATIRNFDRFSIVVDQGGCDQLIFKHAIAVIRPANAIRAGAPTT